VGVHAQAGSAGDLFDLSDVGPEELFATIDLVQPSRSETLVQLGLKGRGVVREDQRVHSPVPGALP
jgi:hypothetical protein